jgi:hypothetical protein
VSFFLFDSSWLARRSWHRAAKTKNPAWDPEARKPLGKPVKAHRSGVYAVGIVPLDEGVAVVSGGKDKLVRLWKSEDDAMGS